MTGDEINGQPRGSTGERASTDDHPHPARREPEPTTDVDAAARQQERELATGEENAS